MGTETIEKATDSFTRKQRRCLDQLEEATLFTGIPRLEIAVMAAPVPGQEFLLNEFCRLSLLDEKIVVIRDITIIGVVINAPKSVIDMMLGPCPSVSGRIAGVSVLTGKAEVLLE